MAAPALLAGQPGAVAARMHPHHLAKPAERVLRLLLADEGVPHVGCLAKYAVASFRMSRSSLTRRNSAFSRRISAAASCIAAPVGLPAWRYARSHSYRF